MIYLDNNATTKLDPQALAEMLPFFIEQYANAAATHVYGLMATDALENARQQVADLIHATPNEIVFTSGSSEAISLAINGISALKKHSNPHIITVQTEHKAVLNTCEYLEKQGVEVTYLPVQLDGILDENIFKNAFRPNTVLACVMLANNETGVLQDIQKLATITHQNSALFMTDATQAIGKIPVDVAALGIDLMPMAAHKFHGPKGVGALFVKKGIQLEPLIHGGNQERGRRSGTSNVPGVVGMGVAASILTKNGLNTVEIKQNRDFLELELLKIEGTKLNGNSENRLPNTTNICFEGCDSAAMMLALGQIAVSNGSACTAATILPSHVLMAMGLSEADAFASLRFSLSRFTTWQEIEETALSVRRVVKQLRAR